MNIVTLLEELVNNLISVAFLSNTLSSINEKIYNDAWKKTKYTVAHNEKRTVINLS